MFSYYNLVYFVSSATIYLFRPELSIILVQLLWLNRISGWILSLISD
jgi:hypothetical protein